MFDLSRLYYGKDGEASEDGALRLTKGLLSRYNRNIKKARSDTGERKMRIKAVIWDLDGTLLNTLDDLAASTNAALAQNGMPQRTTEEVRAFVGNGIRKLMIRAVPNGEANPAFEKTLADFTSHYGAHSRDKTQPYDGILEVLDALTEQGVQHAIVSNKIDFAVKQLSREYFGDRMRSAVGDDPSRARKPAPDSVFAAMRELGVNAQEAVYVGDSDVDVLTARNAGIPCVAVLWGFRDEACLKAAGAEMIARTPKALQEMIERL